MGGGTGDDLDVPRLVKLAVGADKVAAGLLEGVTDRLEALAHAPGEPGEVGFAAGS